MYLGPAFETNAVTPFKLPIWEAICRATVVGLMTLGGAPTDLVPAPKSLGGGPSSGGGLAPELAEGAESQWQELRVPANFNSVGGYGPREVMVADVMPWRNIAPGGGTLYERWMRLNYKMVVGQNMEKALREVRSVIEAEASKFGYNGPF